VNAYSQLKIGDPLNEKNHLGPLIDRQAVSMYLEAIDKCKAKVETSLSREGYCRAKDMKAVAM
jgi:aldehyde dehydrogenase (NAD+)